MFDFLIFLIFSLIFLFWKFVVPFLLKFFFVACNIIGDLFKSLFILKRVCGVYQMIFIHFSFLNIY